MDMPETPQWVAASPYFPLTCWQCWCTVTPALVYFQKSKAKDGIIYMENFGRYNLWATSLSHCRIFYTRPYQNHWRCQFWHQSQWIYGVVVGCRLDIDTTLVVPKLPQIDPSDAEKLHGLSLKMSTEEVMTLISQLAETMESNCWRRKVCRSRVKLFLWLESKRLKQLLVRVQDTIDWHIAKF